MTQINIPSFSQAQVEQRTGLSREVLRKWELRYGFPLPQRGHRGQRHYDGAATRKLELISRLLRMGWRVSKLVGLPVDALQALLDDGQAHATPTPPSALVLAQATLTLLERLQPGQPPAAAPLFLQSQLQQHGLNDFVAYLMPAFNLAVGRAWQAQRVSVAAEHHYTATLRRLVLRALPEPSLNIQPPRVLLATPPGELHNLALLALHAQLGLQGAHCLDLDCQVPAPEVLRMVHDFQVRVVAISASASMPSAALAQYTGDLRRALPEACALWLGGQGFAAWAPPQSPNCTVFNDTSQAVGHWLRLARTSRVKN